MHVVLVGMHCLLFVAWCYVVWHHRVVGVIGVVMSHESHTCIGCSLVVSCSAALVAVLVVLSVFVVVAIVEIVPLGIAITINDIVDYRRSHVAVVVFVGHIGNTTRSIAT